MGAVQKLATVVIIGLTALATLLVLYLADEPNRRDAEATEQEDVAIERGIQSYLTYCLTCHGPAGEGAEGDPGYIGKPIGGNTQARLLNQSTDPVVHQDRQNFIRMRIHAGAPTGCSRTPNATCIMPAWGEDYGGELNNEQIEELVVMIQNVDWDVVYNDAIAANGGKYPEPPSATEAAAPSGQAAQPEGGAASPVVELSAPGISWSTTELTVPVGGTIKITNDGSGGEHNFAIEGYNDSDPVDLPIGQTVEWQVPADLAPGTYTFYCEIPGHRAAGMQGTLTIVPAEEAGGGATPEAGATPGAGASPEAAAPASGGNVVEVSTPGISWSVTEITVSAGDTIRFTNDGSGGEHNFAIEGYNDASPVDLPAGQTVEWQVPADLQPGTYTFYCAIPGHRQLMEGTLTVQ